MLFGVAQPDELTTRETCAQLGLRPRQLNKRRRALGLRWRTVAAGSRQVTLYGAASVGRAAAQLAAERAARPWDQGRIAVARETRRARREAAALAYDVLRVLLRFDLARIGCDVPLGEVPRERLATLREFLRASARRVA